MPDRETANNNANWWRFAIDPHRRGERIMDDPATGAVEINRKIGGRRLLSYHAYLRLDRLLASQRPTSRTPEERVFITTHQHFELVFKQMIFDLRIIADTFKAVLDHGPKDIAVLAQLNGEHKETAGDFWLPACTAAARVKHGCKRVLPAIMAYLATEETFDNAEFMNGFRENLTPASGFQSAQFRLIQRGFGKSHLLEVRLFPADAYLQEYSGLTEHEIIGICLESDYAGLLKVTDPLILRESAAIANPPVSSPLFPVTELDDLAHRLLLKIAETGADSGAADDAMPLLAGDRDALAEVGKTFTQGLRGVLEKIERQGDALYSLTGDDATVIALKSEVFQKDWARAVRLENSRRAAFADAPRGSRILLTKGGNGHLAALLRNLVEADTALSDSFLLMHRQMVERRTGSVPGTAGGGVPFLDYSRNLVSRFPALIGFRAGLTSAAGRP